MRLVRSACACFFLLLPTLSLAAAGKVTLAEGPVTRVRTGLSAQALEVGAQVEDGDTLETGEKARLEVQLADGSVVRLGSRGRLVVDSVTPVETGFRVKLTLALGELWSKVTRKTGPDAGYEVHTDRSVAGVRGTEFVVEAGDEHEVEVLEGKVEVALRDGSARHALTPGLRLRIDRAGKTAGPATGRGERAIAKWSRRDGDKLDRDRSRDRREDRRTKRMDRRELRRERWLR